jgi:hypothetical protein
MLENESTKIFRGEFHDHRGGGGVFLGGNGESIGDDGVEGRNSVTREVATLLGCIVDRKDNLLVHGVGHFMRGGGARDGQAVDTEGVHSERLVQAVHFLRQLVDDCILLLNLLAAAMFSCTRLWMDCSRMSILAIWVEKESNFACREARDSSIAMLRIGGSVGEGDGEWRGDGAPLLFRLVGIKGSNV